MKSLGVEEFKRFFYGELYDIIHSVTKQFGTEVEADTAYISFLTHFYTINLPTIAISWLQGEIEHTAEEIVAMMDTTLKDQLFGAKYRLKESNEATKKDDSH